MGRDLICNSDITESATLKANRVYEEARCKPTVVAKTDVNISDIKALSLDESKSSADSLFALLALTWRCVRVHW